MIDTPVLPSKFFHLKYLSVDLSALAFSPTYDYCSLISFFDASPSLETLVVNVSPLPILQDYLVLMMELLIQLFVLSSLGVASKNVARINRGRYITFEGDARTPP